jgi:hypothetical protein
VPNNGDIPYAYGPYQNTLSRPPLDAIFPMEASVFLPVLFVTEQ